MSHDADALQTIFNPAAVAIVGASEDPNKLGGRPLAMSLQAGFGGRIYPVNARVEVVQGQKAYRSLADLPEPVDLVVLAVPQVAVEAELRAAAKAGAKAAIVFASDYAETGQEGLDRQNTLRELARREGIRLLGPNCMGAFDVHSRFYPTFLQAFDHFDGKGWPEPGEIAIVSQSGAIGSHIFVMMREKGLGLSKFITTGNQCDVDVADCIAFLATDPATKVIAVYLEGTTNGERLLEALVSARRNGKLVVVLKVGESSVGSTAILSHTASIAGSDLVYETLLRAGGAYRARSLTELVEVATAIAGAGLPRDRNACVLSLSGGGGVILTDACEKAGLVLPPMSQATRAKMREIVPFSATQNPIDPGGPAMTNASIVLDFLRLACEEASHSTLFLFLTHLGHVPRMMEPLRKGVEGLRVAYPDRLFVVIVLGSTELGKQLRRAGILVFDEPTSAVRAVRAMLDLKLPPEPPAPRETGSAVLPTPTDWSEVGARALLRQAAVPVVPETLAATAAEAADAVAGFGTACALKLVSDRLPHRAAVGGIKLGVEGRDNASSAFKELMEAWNRTALPGAPAGVLVSPMVSDGTEVFVGARTERGLATVVTLGRGGIDVENGHRMVTRLAPLNPAQAKAMVEEAREQGLFSLVAGGLDFSVVEPILVALSGLAVDHRMDIESIEINPLIVTLDGAVAVDALMTPALDRQTV